MDSHGGTNWAPSNCARFAGLGGLCGRSLFSFGREPGLDARCRMTNSLNSSPILTSLGGFSMGSPRSLNAWNGVIPKVAQWYEIVAQLSEHPSPQVRVTAAWVMGQDSTSELFHNALLDMLHDDEVLVRRNAALALVRFGDKKGLKELRTMLAPDTDSEHVWESLRALCPGRGCYRTRPGRFRF